jgi:hypothetical protein
MRHLHIFLVYLMALGAACEESADTQKTSIPEMEEKREVKTPFDTFENEAFNFQVRYPRNWQTHENPGTGPIEYGAAFYPPFAGSDTLVPLQLHEPAGMTYVIVYPRGLPTELPFGGSGPLQPDDLSLLIEIDQENSKAYSLSSGEPWAYYIVPKNPPDSWNGYGCIFAQAGAENFSANCYGKETGEKKPMRDCKPMMGDRLERSGKPKDLALLREVLQSITFWEDDSPIELRRPVSHAHVNSPLKIQGSAPGEWFFEGSFNIELTTADGKTLAEGRAESKGEWMTNEPVDFQAKLEFEVPETQKGILNFHKANPSGLAENKEVFSIPVEFR